MNNYYGFSLDKDQLFLLEDFTVVHNSWPGLQSAIVQGQELCEVQGIPRGVMVFGGTGEYIIIVFIYKCSNNV